MSLPKTPIKGDPETRRFLEAVRQKVESVENNAITIEDMRRAGFFDRNGIDVGGETPEVQAPTAPTSLAAEGAFENIILTWDYAEYTGHNNSRIYRSLTNVFADAEVLANVDGRVYADLVGGGKTYYYWVSNVNVNNIESATSQASGVQGVTLPDTQFILNTLTNSITESQLFSTLGARINLIDGASTLTGSVNARLNAVQTSLQSQITANGSAIVSVQDVNASQATSITALGTRTGAAESNITNLQTTTSNQATSISNLTSTVNGNTTSIQTLTTTTNGLSGQYTVKIDNNGYVSGFGLASTPVNGTPFSDFIVRADRFSISSPSGPSIAPRTPFIVTTTPTVVNGVSVPAGVYMDSAAIQNGSITNAKIGNAVIDDAKIASLNAAKITTGQLDAARITVDGVSMDTYFDASIGRNRLFIRDLGVSNGKIANLAVDTLKIAGNAVTQTLIFTAPDIYVVDGISSSGGGTETTYTFDGYGNGDYELYVDPDYGTETYYFAGTNLGSYDETITLIPSTVSGGYQVVETPVITVGDAVSGALIIVFYATIDSQSAKDGGQFIVLQVSVNGGAYQTVFESKVGARTSGGDTYSVIPFSVPWSVPLAQTVRVRVYTGNRHISNVPNSTTNPTYMRNIHLSLLGAKR